MKKKTKLPFEEFSVFQNEREKALFKWFFVGDLFFLVASLVLMLLFEGIFKLGVLSWFRYWILVAGNLFILIIAFLGWVRNFKIWLFKYVLAIYSPLLIASWIYFTDPQYVKPLFTGFLLGPILVGILFYDIKSFFLSFLSGAVIYGLLLSYYSRIGFIFAPYEIFLNGLIFSIFLFIVPVGIFRIRIFLTELLQKRRELEESKTTLEIKVKARTQELEEFTQGLEEKIKERTKELQERMEELERFQRLAIGRELKMIELKEEIKKLKKGKEK